MRNRYAKAVIRRQHSTAKRPHHRPRNMWGWTEHDTMLLTEAEYGKLFRNLDFSERFSGPVVVGVDHGGGIKDATAISIAIHAARTGHLEIVTLASLPLDQQQALNYAIQAQQADLLMANLPEHLRRVFAGKHDCVRRMHENEYRHHLETRARLGLLDVETFPAKPEERT